MNLDWLEQIELGQLETVMMQSSQAGIQMIELDLLWLALNWINVIEQGWLAASGR
jgi:hypothetical protein